MLDLLLPENLFNLLSKNLFKVDKNVPPLEGFF